MWCLQIVKFYFRGEITQGVSLISFGSRGFMSLQIVKIESFSKLGTRSSLLVLAPNGSDICEVFRELCSDRWSKIVKVRLANFQFN